MTPAQRDNLLEAHSQAMDRIAELKAERDQFSNQAQAEGWRADAMQAENARLRQALEDAPHEYLCLAKWKSHWDTGDWWELKEAQPELCNCWKAALARIPEACP